MHLSTSSRPAKEFPLDSRHNLPVSDLQYEFMKSGPASKEFRRPRFKIFLAPSTIGSRMDPARIAELLAPFLKTRHAGPGGEPSEGSAVLSSSQLNHISTYVDILRHWNARINLTAIRDEEEIITRHFGESFFAAIHLFPSAPPVLKDSETAGAQIPKVAVRVADVGSGAGFPGLPIKLWSPNIALTLIESNQKKATFLREVTRSLTLMNVDIQNARAETLPAAAFDVVTLRAVERFTEILPTAGLLVAPEGRLALLVSSSQLGAAVSTLPAFNWRQPLPIPQSQSRVLLIAHRGPIAG